MATRRRPGKPPPWRRGRSLRLVIGAVAALAAVVLVVWTVNRGASETPSGARIGHIHGLGVNPADGTLYVATHDGVFRLTAVGSAERVGKGTQDTMGFTVVSADHFLASGHPGAGEEGPGHLGLIESVDGGATWRGLSLQGRADFHALRFRHGAVYGFNSVSGQFLVSRDRVAWDTRSAQAMRDFAVAPGDPDTIVATTAQGPVRSRDGGRTWTPAGGPPLMVLEWERDDRLWGVAAGGEVFRSADGGTTWSPAGTTGAGAPAAITAHGGTLHVASAHGEIWNSRDLGANWSRQYPTAG